ncbi:MAG: hypothetical protein WA924_14530 [Burkholderiaceae bacterium]
MEGILAGATGRRQRDATKRRLEGTKRRKGAPAGAGTAFNLRQYFYYCLSGKG